MGNVSSLLSQTEWYMTTKTKIETDSLICEVWVLITERGSGRGGERREGEKEREESFISKIEIMVTRQKHIEYKYISSK